MKNTTPIFEQVKAAGIPFASHESDLYIPATEQTCAMLDNLAIPVHATTFINKQDGKLWYDIPFAYLPFWEEKQRQAEKLASVGK